MAAELEEARTRIQEEQDRQAEELEQLEQLRASARQA
eukprot:COSAG02_NODE_76885_length_130_cov_160.806452_1_plen_36_part_10